MQWTPIWGNCNTEFFMARDEWVRCTAVANHQGLHRCHYQPTPEQTCLLMWGETPEDVSIERLANEPNPLGLIATLQKGEEQP